MPYLFQKSKFNGDISRWDVSKVENILYMFYSEFDKYEDLNNWKPYNLKTNYISEKELHTKVYWNSENINLEKDDIVYHINKYFAEKEKQLLINKDNSINLNSKKELFKL